MLIPVLLFIGALQTAPITAAEAKAHIGHDATVCGTVKSARFAENSNGQPTFLNLDKGYPNPIFTVVIFGADRAKFDQPEVKYREKEICVSGKIRDYRGGAEIVVSDPKQISEPKK